MEQLQQIGTQLGIDETFLYLLGMIFAFYFVLSFTYLKPFQKLLMQRRARTEGTKKDAGEITEKAEIVFEQYRSRLKEVTDQARASIRASEEDAKKEEAAILDQASQKAKTSLQGAQKELDDQKKATLDSLSQDISGLASEFASKVLGRQISAR